MTRRSPTWPGPAITGTTAPGPPDTLPTTSYPPAADTASAAPGSRGALRYVRTTVARPKLSPASHHLVILLRMSRTCFTSAVNVLLEVTGWTAAHIPGENSPRRP